jgi:membrane-bound lytic murein transglycosylase D
LNVPTPPPVVKLVHYRVHTGDTLEGIADRFDVTVAELKRWNGIRGSKAPRGARLRIYAGGQPAEPTHAKTKPEGDAPAAVQNVSASGSDSKRYHVKPGETLYSIAHAHKTTVEALRESNSFLLERPLKAGDTLVIQR